MIPLTVHFNQLVIEVFADALKDIFEKKCSGSIEFGPV